MLKPLENFLSFLFSGAYGITGNYGLSLLALSVMVNLILLPVYLPLEKWKKKKAMEQAPMKKELEAIKRAYRGRERYFYTNAVHRRHNYKPLESVILSLGLLIQIPFFLAAYHMLSHYSALNGVSFWFIENLSLPDGSLILAGIPVNILPLVMTGLNLISAFLYTKETSERIPLWIMAGVFLILLYRSPAGLVLYWTANNLFALIKQIPEVPSYINGTDRNRMKKIFPLIGIWAYYCIPLFAFYLSFVSLFYPAVAHRSKIILPAVVMILLFLQEVIHLLLLVFSKGRGRKRRLAVAAALFIFLIYQAVSGLNFIPGYISTGLEKLSSAGVFKRQIALFTVQTGLGLLLTFPFIYRSVIWKSKKLGHGFSFQKKGALSGWEEMTLSLILIAGAWLLWIPAMVYSSLPGQFSFSAGEMLMENLLPFFIIVAGGTVLSLLTPGRWRIIPWVVLTAAASGVFIYAFVIPFDFGFLTGFSLSKSEILQGDAITYIADFSLIVVLFSIMRAAAERWRKGIFAMLLCLNILLIGQGFHAMVASKTPVYENKKGSATDLSSGELELTVPLSESEQNVVVFMMDMMTGGYLFELLEDFPELEEDFDGFTWFPNTMAVGTNTVAGQPAIMGGPEFAPAEVNRRSLEHSVIEEIGRAYNVMIEKAMAADLDVTLVEPFEFGFLLDKWPSLKELDVTVHSIDDYVGNLEQSYIEDAAVGDETAINKKLLKAIALFRAVPYGLKSFVYEDGFWRPLSGALVYQSYFKQLLPEWLMLTKLPEMTIASDIRGQYYFITSLLAHHPHALSAEGILLSDRFPDPSVSDNRDGRNAYYSTEWSLKILADWFKDLKEKGLYDNTKIIIVSDHGNYRSADYSAPVKNKDRLSALGLDKVNHTAFNSMLMVKDFNGRGSLKRKEQNMSSSDTAQLAFNPDASAWIDSLDSKRVVEGQLTHAWNPKEQTGPEYESFGVFQVNGDFYDINNWKRVGD